MLHPKHTHSRRTGALFILCALVILALGWGAFTYNSTHEQDSKVHPVDSGFARSMILHHAQAIQMSTMMRDKASPEMQALAQSIIMKQTREMGVMEGWLTAWHEPVMVEGPPMAWVENATNVRHLDDQLYQAQCKADGGAMAGVATPEQLKALNEATGTDKEKLFLQLMIAHHEAALPMAWFAHRNGESSLVKALATAMIRDQAMELGWMKLKLQQIDKS